MDKIWIVYSDSELEPDIVGVFDDHEEATAYAEEVSAHFPTSLLTMGFPVPYRFTDKSTVIPI